MKESQTIGVINFLENYGSPVILRCQFIIENVANNSTLVQKRDHTKNKLRVDQNSRKLWYPGYTY